MSFEMAQAILDEVSATRVASHVLFHVMGEPTLCPNLVNIVKYSADRGINTCLTTNGSLLDEKLLDRLIHAGINTIIISLQTPDEKTFSFRGAKALHFEDYAERITIIARRFLREQGRTKLIISFLSTPLRRLIFPISPEFSIADTSADIKRYLKAWYEKIVCNSHPECKSQDVLKKLKRVRSFQEKTVKISERLFFNIRILGDWAGHFDKKNVNAIVGYCPGIQENFGILWNGDYTFCCTDFDGCTSTHNYNRISIMEYLGQPEVQKVVRGFQRFRVLHPYCKQCIGDKSIVNTIVKQMGSIVYFKMLRSGSKII